MAMKMILGTALAALLALPVNVYAQTAFHGRWDVKMKMRDQERPAKLVITEKDGVLSGMWITPRGKEKLQNVKVDGKILRFERKLERQDRQIVLKNEVKVNDGKLAGKIITPRGEMPFSGVRAKNNSDEISFPGGKRTGHGDGSGRPRGPDGGRPSFSDLLSRFDTNGDGSLQKGEAPSRMQEHFDKLDANGDGAVDAEEAQRGADRPRHRDRP
jgi:EF hand